jgi:pimeloyl-ACP methyl ester carboxylesterase
MGSVNCNGVSINYRCVGEGKNVVLIHGLAANHGFWHFDVLLKLARKYRVTVFDLRGHGYSSMPSSGYTTASMVGDLHCLMDHLKIQRANLIGHSYGGAIGLHYAALYPERVSSLVIADSRIRALQPTNRPQHLPNWKFARETLDALGLKVPEDETEIGLWLLEQLALPQRRKIRHKLAGTPLFIPFSNWTGGNRSAERWLKMLTTTTARQEFVARDGLTIEKLSKLNIPTLIIYGENSQVLPSYNGLRKHLPMCKSALVEKAGHFFPLSKPHIFVRIVIDFLKQFDFRDRRRDERLSRKFAVQLKYDGYPNFAARTLNVSKYGLLIESTQIIAVGSEVGVEARVKPDGGKLWIEGRIVWQENNQSAGPYRLGIELISDGDDYKVWQNYLAA